MSLSFLEANAIATSSNDLKEVKFVLASSSQTEKIDIFLKAHCILNGFNADYQSLPFNTLAQYLESNPQTDIPHVFIVFPWDIIAEADWRTGIGSSNISLSRSQSRTQDFLSKLDIFPLKHIIYLPAKILPVHHALHINQQIEQQLIQNMLVHGATILKPEYFSLSSYLSNGSALSSKKLSSIAQKVASSLTNRESKKILITDLDNVMWKGVIGEDGLNGINCTPEGSGFVHFIYQTYLMKLESQGILIAAVSKNDNETALRPFNNHGTHFKQESFVAFIASYQAKSSQIENLLEKLNLPLDSAVFVDDNPIEIEEVKSKLPSVSCITFPQKNEAFPKFLEQLQNKFDIPTITSDDKNRTELYKTRTKAIQTSHEEGSDLKNYLRTLNMELTIQIGSENNFQRALQLINKTNQFNLNGKRLTEEELTVLLQKKYSLYSFSLKDKFGEHGQIASILISDNNHIHYFVMSCRVFQRKIEHAVLLWLIQYNKIVHLKFDFVETPKNIPVKIFMSEDLSVGATKHLDIGSFLKNNSETLDLFKIDLISK